MRSQFASHIRTPCKRQNTSPLATLIIINSPPLLCRRAEQGLKKLVYVAKDDSKKVSDFDEGLQAEITKANAFYSAKEEELRVKLDELERELRSASGVDPVREKAAQKARATPPAGTILDLSSGLNIFFGARRMPICIPPGAAKRTFRMCACTFIFWSSRTGD